MKHNKTLLFLLLSSFFINSVHSFSSMGRLLRRRFPRPATTTPTPATTTPTPATTTPTPATTTPTPATTKWLKRNIGLGALGTFVVGCFSYKPFCDLYKPVNRSVLTADNLAYHLPPLLKCHNSTQEREESMAYYEDIKGALKEYATETYKQCMDSKWGSVIGMQKTTCKPFHDKVLGKEGILGGSTNNTNPLKIIQAYQAAQVLEKEINDRNAKAKEQDRLGQRQDIIGTLIEDL